MMKTLKIAFRNLLKNKLVSTINWVGLTMGVLISLLILSYVQKEKDTDKFIKDVNDIQVITVNGKTPISKPMFKLLQNHFTQMPITYMSGNWSKQIYLADDNSNKFKVNNLLDADSSFFKVFQFETLYGDLKNALNSTNKIVLTENLAKKIFGNVNPIGKSLSCNTEYFNNEQVQVTAVLKELPKNTSWKFDAIVSMETNNKISWYEDNANNWGSMNYLACCRLTPNADVQNFSSQLQTLVENYKKTDGDEIIETFGIYPFLDNYFIKSNRGDIFKYNTAETLMILQLIVVIILLMAAINYINLVSAQRQKRNKSVAIIKMLGSQRWGVVLIFMAEAGIMLLAVLLGVALFASPTIDLFNKLMTTQYTTALILSGTSFIILSVIILFLFLTTGIIPGLIFSRQQTLKLLKPDVSKHKASFMRNVLPITQFAVSIILITCLFAMKKQNNMMLNQQTGFNKEQIVFMSTNSDITKNYQAFNNELKTISNISEYCYADACLGQIGQNWGVNITYKGEEKDINFTKLGVSGNFLKFFGIKIKEGNVFSESKTRSEFIMNETAIKQYGMSDFADIRLHIGNANANVVGVVEDFNFRSAHTPIKPIAFRYEGEISNVCFLKLNAQSLAVTKQTLAEVEAIWNKLSPNLPMEYQFLDESWNALYKREMQFQTMLNYAGFVSLFIACMGLFGLSLFVAERRTKEIGIRKINGATITEILTMLNKSFVKWIIIAFVIATPIAYYTMNRWLENFAYKTELSWWIFALAGISALLIALLTVSWQSWRAASRNPVEALRYE